jgi:predicted DNA-binding transcriptional regulator AlpA
MISNTAHDLVSTRHDRILRMRELQQQIGLSPSHIYFLIKEDAFPRPFKLVPGGRASGWLASTIDAWLLVRSTQGGAK